MQLNQNFSDFFDKPAAAPETASAPPANVDEFVRQVEPAARRVAERLRVPVEAVIGQWGLETGWGKSVIPGTNNLGNIKDMSGGGVAATDNMTGSRDRYRSYQSVDQFADDFAGLLSNGRYRSVPGTRDANSYFAGLKAGGYAEDPGYVEKGTQAASMVGEALKRAPAGAQAPAADKFAGVPAWTDIQAKPEFKALPPAKQLEAKQAYFDYWIAPRAGQDAGAIREQFLGGATAAPAPAPAPAVDEQAGKAAFGVYPKAKSAKPAAPVLEQPGPVPDQEFTSRVPVKPEVRRAFEAAWNSATPTERAMMGAAPGWTGQLARERAGYAKAADEGMANASSAMRTTLEAIDPRAEFRAARLRTQGEDPRFAETAGREGAKRGVMPGQEIKALDGTVQESTFNFETADFFDPNNPANGANNALVRGITKGALGIGKAYAGLFQFQSDLVGFDAASKSAADAGRSMRGQEEAIGERGTFLERNLEGAVSSIAQQLPLLITGTAAASQAIPLAGMALQSFGQEYSDGRARGQDAGQATIRASMFAAFEVLGEKFGIKGNMEAIKAVARGQPTEAAFKFLSTMLKKDLPGEILTTTGQFSVDKFAGSGIGLNPNATFEDYMKQVADTIAQTIMQGGLMAAGGSGVGRSVQFLRDRGVSQGVAEADAEAAKRTALDRWSGFMGRKQPAATTPTTVDGRIEPTIDAPPAGDPLVQTADEIVRGMATDAGLPESTVLPGAATATPAITQADQDIIDFAGTRFQQLRDKRGTPEEPGPGLSATEEFELQTLVRARDNPVALRAFYGIDEPGEADVRQTQEPFDGAPSGPAAGAQGQAAAAQVPEQPGQQPNEAGQAQGLNQAIGGLGALFGGQQQETEDQREARLEREAIQGEQGTQVAPPTNDDDIPLDLGPPRTEKEARERKEQQANVQAGQAQQTQAPREEAVSAPAAPQGAGAEGGVGAPNTEKQAKNQRDVEAFTARIQSATSVEEVSRIAKEASGRFPDTDVLGEREPNDDDRAMAAITQAAVQRARQITEGGEVAVTKPQTEREAKAQRLAERPLPDWTQRTQGFPANTTFAWEQDGDNVVLVAKVGDQEFGRVAESQVKDGTSVGTMKLTKALVDESLRQAGGTTELNWTPEGGDTSVEDAKKRKEQSKDNRSRAKRQLEAAIEKADEAGAMKTKSKLVDLLMAFDRKDKGPAQVTKALESLDADIEKETTVKTPVSEEEKLVTAISEVTFDKGTVQDFIDKHGKAAFKRALELGYIDNTLEFPTSKLFATNKVVYELQQKYYQFPIGKRPVRKKPEKPQKTQAQGGTTSPEGAGGSQPTPAPTPATPATPTLEGVKVKFDVMVEDTGQTASMTVDAAAQMKEYDERESVLRELIACLQK